MLQRTAVTIKKRQWRLSVPLRKLPRSKLRKKRRESVLNRKLAAERRRMPSVDVRKRSNSASLKKRLSASAKNQKSKPACSR